MVFNMMAHKRKKQHFSKHDRELIHKIKADIEKDDKWYWQWRHLCAYLFMAVVAFDFIIMPSLFHPWTPLTTQSNGMFFVAFAAILGPAAYTRGQERINRFNTLSGLTNGFGGYDGYDDLDNGYTPYGGSGMTPYYRPGSKYVIDNPDQR
jgi:hypothetical protein